AAEDARPGAPLEDLRDHVNGRHAEAREAPRLPHVLSPVHVLVAHDADEVGVRLVVIECELGEPPNRLPRLEVLDVQFLLGHPDQVVGPFQDRNPEAFFTTEVVIDHPLCRTGPSPDLVNPRAGIPPIGELAGRDLQDVFARPLAVAPASRVVQWLDGGRLRQLTYRFVSRDPSIEQSLSGRPDRQRHHHVALLGAGGAGSAVAYALLRLGAARIVVVDPASERADRLAATLQSLFGRDRVTAASPSDLPGQLHGADGLVNASPMGMASNPASPASTDLLRDSLWVAEIVYRPLETELLRAARQRGCRTLDGGGMAVFQAAGAFELFTGQKPDAERMLEHLPSL